MDGLAFIQTKGTPCIQGDLNVLPMHELTVAVAACGLCTDCEGHPPGSSFLRAQKSRDQQQRDKSLQEWALVILGEHGP